MSATNDKPQDAENTAQQSGLSNDPGKASQRGAHVNDARAEDPSRRDTDSEPNGGLNSDRTEKKEKDIYGEGDAQQDGTQNRKSVDSSNDTGAGSGNLTAENKASRSDKFGPEHNSTNSGI